MSIDSFENRVLGNTPLQNNNRLARAGHSILLTIGQKWQKDQGSKGSSIRERASTKALPVPLGI
jgi:hypothetical protein